MIEGVEGRRAKVSKVEGVEGRRRRRITARSFALRFLRTATASSFELLRAPSTFDSFELRRAILRAPSTSFASFDSFELT